MADNENDRLEITAPSGSVSIIESDSDLYDYVFIDTDGNEFPIWPGDTPEFYDMVNEFEKRTSAVDIQVYDALLDRFVDKALNRVQSNPDQDPGVKVREVAESAVSDPTVRRTVMAESDSTLDSEWREWVDEWTEVDIVEAQAFRLLLADILRELQTIPEVPLNEEVVADG